MGIEAGYLGRDARSREFVATLPTTGSVIFVQDRYGQQALRDLVILMHGVRVNEVTSIFVAERVEDERQYLTEERRPVFRHPDLAAVRCGVTVPVQGDTHPRVPRREPDGGAMGGGLTPISIAGVSPRDLSPQGGPVFIYNNLTDAGAPVFAPAVTAVPEPNIARPTTSAAPGSLDSLRDWSMPGVGVVNKAAEPEPEGDLIIATINIIRDRRSGRPYLLQAPSVRRGTFMETHITLDAAIAALPAIARRVVGIPWA